MENPILPKEILKSSSIEIIQTDARFISVNINSEPSALEFDTYLNELTKVIHSGKNLLMQYNLYGKFLPSDMRIKQGKWAEETDGMHRANVRALGFFTSSLIASIMLKGVFAIKKPPVDYIVSNNQEEVRNWLMNRGLLVLR